MPQSPAPSSSRRPIRLLSSLLALVVLAAVGTLELRASQASGAAIRALEARMAGAGEGDGNPLPSRDEIETLLVRQAAGAPSTAADGSLKVVYRWPGVFRSYEVRAYYSPGAVARLVRYESREASATTPQD